MRRHQLARILVFSAITLLAAATLSTPTAQALNIVNYWGGPVMHTSTTYAIFWLPNGKNFEPYPGSDLNYENLITRFLTDVGGTSYYNMVAQYNDNSYGAPLPLSTFGGSYIDTTPYPVPGTPEEPLRDSHIQAAVSRAMTAKGWTPGPTRIFLVFTAYGIESCRGSENNDCSFNNYCAYHSYFTQNGQPVIYAHLPDSVVPTRQLCPYNLISKSPNLDKLADTQVTLISRTLFGIVTDPFRSAWFDPSDPTGGEIGDTCQIYFEIIAADGSNVVLNGRKYIVQAIWSEQEKSCVLIFGNLNLVSLNLTPQGSNKIPTDDSFKVTYFARGSAWWTTTWNTTGSIRIFTDSITNVTIAAKSVLSTDSDRFCFNQGCTEVSFNSTRTGITATYSYYLMLLQRVSRTTLEGGLPADSTVTFVTAPNVAGGSSVTQTVTLPLGPGSVSIWPLRNTQVTIPSTILGGQAERWMTATTSWTVTSPTQIGTVAYHHQFSTTFNFDAVGGGTFTPTIKYSSAGVQATTSARTTVWADVAPYSYQDTVPGTGPTERWAATSYQGTVSSSAPISVTYYHQFRASVAYSLSGGGEPSPPVLSYTTFGDLSSIRLDRTVSNVWLDSGSSYNIIAVLEPTRPTERWLSPIAATGTVAAGLNLAPTYFHQYLASFEYSVIGGGNAQAPTLAFPSMGKKNAVPITSSQDSWVDSGLEWNATNPLVMSTSSERWYSSSAKGLVSSPGKQSLRYYHQYSFTSSYSIVGGRGPTPVFLSSTSSGEDLKIQLALAPTKLWFDAEASWAVSKSITTSRTERWQSVDATTSGRATSPGTISPSYYHQYLVPVSSKSYGLGSISDLTLKSFSLGTQESNRLSTSGIEVWMDNGTKWTLGYPSLASAPGERWLASGEAGTVSNSGEISLLFYHQVSLSASYSIRGSAIGSKPPTLQSTSTGSPFSTQLTTFRSDYWLDFGVPYNVTGALEGSSGKQRWLLRDTTPGTAINGTNVSALYYQQLLVNATYSVGGGNTFGFTAPKLDSMVFGRPYSVTLTREPVNAWLDAGAAYKITASLPARSPSERWQTQKDSGTISPSTIINPQYKLQYLVTLRTEPANGGSISPKVEWTDAGNSVTLSATANPRWTFKFWNGTGTESYSGMNNPIPLVVNGPVNQTALFYPSLTITNGNEGVVELAYNNTAETIGVDSFKTFSVQPGSSVTISAGNHPIIYKLVGWDGLPNEPSAKVTFRVDSPLSIRPHYELDVLNIGLILAAITGMVVIFRRVLRR